MSPAKIILRVMSEKYLLKLMFADLGHKNQHMDFFENSGPKN